MNIPDKAAGIRVFLGGHDAEMLEIKKLAEEHGIPVVDKHLGWGAKDDVFERDILEAMAAGDTPVFIEVERSLHPEYTFDCHYIDHHGERAKEEASILQFMRFAHITVDETRQRLIDLIAANDSAYIPGMLALDATPEEITKIRMLERSAQGITPEQEVQAEEAIASMERLSELQDLIIIRLQHSKCSTVTDRLFGLQAHENILVLSADGEVNYFGDGALCAELKERFQGWNGGSGLGEAGKSAYWGGYPDHAAVTAFVKERMAEPAI